MMSRDRYGMAIHWKCRLVGHRWSDWHPVGHIEDAEHRWCHRGCGSGQMRYRHPADPEEA